MTSQSFTENVQFIYVKGDALMLQRDHQQANTDMIRYIIKLANIARKAGLLTLETEVSTGTDDQDLKDLLQLVIAGTDPCIVADYGCTVYTYKKNKDEKFNYYIKLYMVLAIQEGWNPSLIETMINPLIH